ncbi:MAG: GNAT family N-acetyltransferase [Pseudomonadota bacterium]
MNVEHRESLLGLDPASWDLLVPDGHPFLCHAFLASLERTNCLGYEAGWVGAHHLAWNDGQLAGALVCWIKLHGYGEYNFDHQFAHAWTQLGGSFYPKMLVAIPFTPVSGPRILVRPGEDQDMLIRRTLIDAACATVAQNQFSGLTVNFCQDSEQQFLADRGFAIRSHHQYHWFNQGFEDFEAFLASLTSRKRKQIKRERRQLAAMGVSFRWLHGDQMGPAEWNVFYECYASTYGRKWGVPYLTRDFFSAIGEAIPSQILVVQAFHEGVCIASALNFIGATALYGRNWGCLKQIPFLHFETCYYQAIEFAIANGLERVEAGTQGEHKLQRGYVPSSTWSAHWFPHPKFMRAVSQYLAHERKAQGELMGYLKGLTPFKNPACEPEQQA